jgi:tetratricopeptide (TPR) repeat protein
VVEVDIEQCVRVWEGSLTIPTYPVGTPDRNPLFLEKRVYQGSSGQVYPYAVIDRIGDEAVPTAHRALFLENEYLLVIVLPDIGGRVYRMLDKTNDYDCIYYNRVLKPALVGLAGPWVAGGIEFNWPQHHRPNTYGPVSFSTCGNADGSCTIHTAELDRMRGTRAVMALTLRPGRAVLEIDVRLFNCTALPEAFLWWANPAVAANEHTQSIFPPDVHAVFDHGKRDVSRFPIATGTYYKVDYSAGVDISRFSNIPVPMSYMAHHSEYDFLGGYDHARAAGILHVADHRIAPGKKQWTWGSGQFGQAWERQLTDEDGPYVELMAGVFTDNQPDFTWMHPGEEKRFSQYFFPYKGIGCVKNATVEAAVNLTVADGAAQIGVYVTRAQERAQIQLKHDDQLLWRTEADLSPQAAYEARVGLDDIAQAHRIRLEVTTCDGRLLVAFQPPAPPTAQDPAPKLPQPQSPLARPEQLRTTEALLFAGRHLEQYRHATFDPEAYYEEGLRREPDDSRLNMAMGVLLARRLDDKRAQGYLEHAVTAVTRLNPNPYDGEPHYQLGLLFARTGQVAAAYDVLSKAAWCAPWSAAAHFALAQLDARRKLWAQAREHIAACLAANPHHLRALSLSAALARQATDLAAAEQAARAALELDPLCPAAHRELYQVARARQDQPSALHYLNECDRLLAVGTYATLALAAEYAEAGLFEDGAELLRRSLDRCQEGHALLLYALGYCAEQSGDQQTAAACRAQARVQVLDRCFANTAFEAAALEAAVASDPQDGVAPYLLGNLMYDRRRHEQAIDLWEQAASLLPGFPTVRRNLAIATVNVSRDPERGYGLMQSAFELDPTDARVLFELDQLRKKLGHAPADRLELLQAHDALVRNRDDLYIECVTLHNLLGAYSQALHLLMSRNFHPWEGGEGKPTGQYVRARLGLARSCAVRGDWQQAVDHARAALVQPDNLGEGRLYGRCDNEVHYVLGECLLRLGDEVQAAEQFQLASRGSLEPEAAIYYNDQPPHEIYYQGAALRALGCEDAARGRFNRLIAHAQAHLHDDAQIDYFAVSLPNLLIFDDNPNTRNRIHCLYIMALGEQGLHNLDRARALFAEVLRLDPNHEGAVAQLQTLAPKAEPVPPVL